MKKHLTLNIKKLIPVIFLIIFSTLSYPQSSHKSTPRNKENYNHLHQINETPHGVFRYGSVSGNESNAPSFREFSPNYFHIENSDSSLWNGRHWDKKSHPLKIFIQHSDSKNYKPFYKNYIVYAFNVWKKADNRIAFIFVSTADSADIKIAFVNNLMKKYDEKYLGLTKTNFNKTREITNANVQLSLLKFDNKRIADGEMKATIIHEMGHVLGLGHSNNDKDIMYPYIDPTRDKELDFNELSSGDYLAIRSLTDLGFKNQHYYIHK